MYIVSTVDPSLAARADVPQENVNVLGNLLYQQIDLSSQFVHQRLAWLLLKANPCLQHAVIIGESRIYGYVCHCFVVDGPKQAEGTDKASSVRFWYSPLFFQVIHLFLILL